MPIFAVGRADVDGYQMAVSGYNEAYYPPSISVSFPPHHPFFSIADCKQTSLFCEYARDLEFVQEFAFYSTSLIFLSVICCLYSLTREAVVLAGIVNSHTANCCMHGRFGFFFLLDPKHW